MTDTLFPERERLREELTAAVRAHPVPAHIGIIMDGNGRWAKQRGWSRIRGHQMGARRVDSIVRAADRLGVRYLTLYAFSVENWARPSFEVSALMRLFRTYIVRKRAALHAENARFRLLGRREGLAPEILEEARQSTELMKNNTGLTLNLCINYGGRAEIVDAVKKIVADGLRPEDVTEEAIARRLYAPDLPDPDLIIRTSGEMRISNFLLWECAYSELYVTDVMWPDFDEVELLRAIQSYQNRERRFGKISEQLGNRR
ncbi:MAG: Undecaprenyl diphosphate synthase [Candidatus Ozemobacter sibiricus]|jgi:undecaprenyl diphosphate synthase|uniref:Isoprenyl transferase n=1 Tax=Candidatus Ozemobacter sibiricus TaxID=2268124 RepID=A0A367ZQK8_9BACT|nr:MAG: Undecaprenyl diphosphate synthase [Candidatus Ozemobacter sibiricus]